MDCIDSRVFIKPYLDGKLDSKNMKKLMEHVDTCPDCKDELKLQYFLKEGLSRLEYGGSLDLKKDFETSIKESKAKVKILGILNSISVVAFALFSFITLAILILGII